MFTQTGTACGNPFIRIVVPEIGSITISPGEYITNSRPESTSPGIHPRQVFALSHDMLQGISGQASQAPPTLASNTEFDGEQARRLESGSGMHPELPSIDFDWASTMMPNFENDWAWLNDLNYRVIMITRIA
jgi:hypothetical protein